MHTYEHHYTSGKAAVPLSKCTILGAAIGNFQVLSTEKHPVTKEGPVIDYETSSFMQAGELLGVVFGVLLNMVLTETEIMIFLVVLLTYNSYNTLKKGVTKWNAETKAKEAAEKEAAKESDKDAETKEGDKSASGGSVELTVSTRGDDETDLTMNELESDDDKADASEKGQKPVEINAATEESNVQFPRWAYAIIISMTLYTVLYASMKSPSFKLLWPCGDLTAVYWIWYFTPVLFLGGAMLAVARILKKSYETKRAAGWEYTGYTKAEEWLLENDEKVKAAEGGEGDDEEREAILAKKKEAEETGYVKLEDAPYYDMVWTNANLWKFPKTALLAGLAAGLLGIGGGMVLGPLFIEIGMQPTVAKSSCAFMILWTGLSGVIQYWMADKLGWQLALYFIMVGYCSGQIGQRGLKQVIKATGRESIVILLLGGIIGLACISMVVTGSISIDQKAQCGDYDFWTPSVEEFGCKYFEDYYYGHRR
mmetsp:Transcript_8684/g.15496  ORF Transcript_8684/g.15496 Transcript_8684/m.15496 type:complete len:481 (+) Transcript_8684:337-1779(+)